MSASADAGGRGLKVILYTMLPPVLPLLRAWATRHGYRIPLVVTTPGPASRRNTSYRDIVAMLPPEQDILVATRMRRPIPLLESLAPDLIVSAGFPYRIPPEVT